MKEVSYVMVKPGFANDKRVINEIKRRLFSKGLQIVEEAYVKYDAKRAQEHYHEHVGKGFYQELENYITSDKVYGMKVVGEEAISVIRQLIGSTKNPEIGTIRYDIPKFLGKEIRITENVVHASDCENASKEELKIFEELKKEKALEDDFCR